MAEDVPQRPEMSYEVHLPEGPQRRSWPLVVAVLGDFAGRSNTAQPLSSRTCLPVTAKTLDAVLRKVSPTLRLRVDNVLPGAPDESLDVELRFQCLADFEPARVLTRIPQLALLWNRRDEGSESLRAQLDEALGRQLGCLLRAPEFRQLEGRWRGLALLAEAVGDDETVELRLLPATRQELEQDLKCAGGVDRSGLAGQLDGELYGATTLLWDEQLTQHPQDVELLDRLARLGEYGSCLMISGAAPGFFGAESWSALDHDPGRIAQLLQSPLLAKWNSLRQHDAARHLALVAPRVVARPAYAGFSLAGDGPSVDDGGGDVAEAYCWMNSAYLLLAQLVASHRQTGWPVTLAGARRGRPWNDELAWLDAPSSSGTALLPLELGWTREDRAAELIHSAGCIPLAYSPQDGGEIVWGPLVSCHAPPALSTPQAERFAAETGRLDCVLAVDRLSLYLRGLAYERSGQPTAGDWQRVLDQFLQEHVSGQPAQPITATGCLGTASVEVARHPRSGQLQAVLSITPWLEDRVLSAPLKLTIPLGS